MREILDDLNSLIDELSRIEKSCALAASNIVEGKKASNIFMEGSSNAYSYAISQLNKVVQKYDGT